MKKNLHLLSKRVLILCLFLISSLSWGQTTGSITITRTSLPSGSLSYGTDDLWTVTSTTGEIIEGYFDIFSNQNQSYLQTRTSTPLGSYPYNTVILPGSITGITLTGAGTGTARSWTPYLSTTALSKSNYTTGTNQGAKTATSNEASTNWVVNASSGFKYFYINMSGGAAYLDSIVVTYEIPAATPTVTTTAATMLSTNSATFNGSANANGFASTTSFEYGTSETFGTSIIATPSSLNNSVTTNIASSVSSLSVNTNYFYRAVITTNQIAANGSTMSFWTLANVPSTPTVNGATITTLNVALNANDGNPDTTQYAIYELTTNKFVQANGTLESTEVWNTISGWTSIITVNGLAAATTYEFYVKARNGANSSTNLTIEGAFGTTLENTLPTLEANSLNSFGETCNTTSAEIQTLNVVGINLTTDSILVGPLAGFAFSVDGANFTSQVLLNADANGNLAEEVLVQFTPTLAQSYNGNILVSGGGATSINVSAVGSGINTPPTIATTTSQSAITSTTAVLGGSVLTLGCSAITERGIYYSTTSGFANGEGNKISQISTFTAEAFTTNVSGLTSNTNYYFKAFATSAGGTVYSSQGTFKTLIDYCAGDHFYDAGGLSDNYSNNENITTVITPSTGNIVTVTFNSFDTESNYDFLKVYDGPNVSAPALHTGVGFSGTTIPGPFTSTHPSGTLTFVFTSDVSNTGSGWDATVTCNPLPTCIKPTSLNTSLVTSISVKLNWTASLSNPTDGYDYYYDTSSTAPIESTIASGNVGAEENSVTLSTLSSATTYYYWVRANCGSDDYSEWAAGGSFTTAQLSAPVATAAQEITATGFTANWNAVDGASEYLLDVYEISESPSPELIANGDFENSSLSSFTFETGMNQVLSTSQQHTGTKSLYSTVTTTKNFNQDIIVNSGQQYILRFWYYIDNSTSGNGFRVWTTVGTDVKLPSSNTFYNEKGSWKLVEENFTASANLVKLNFRLYNGVKIYFDDISVKLAEDNYVKVPILGSPFTSELSSTSYSVTGLEPEKEYYYVVRAVNGTTSPNSNEITVTTAAAVTSTTWNGTAWSNTIGPDATTDAIINGDYAETTDITAKNLTINTGFTVNVNPLNTLTVAGNLVNNGSIIFESTEAGTARFAAYTGEAISGTGTTTVERYIPAKRAWRLLTAPLKGAENNSIFANWQNNGADADGSTGIMLWNPVGTSTPTAVNNGLFLGPQANIKTFNAGAWTDITHTNDFKLFTANGNNAFLAFVTGPHASNTMSGTAAATTASATGSLITGTVAHTLVANQFKMIANPYASPLNTFAMFAHNSANTKMWVIDPSIGLGAYVTYDGENWSTAPEGDGVNIQSGQAFFVRNAVAGEFTINETDKVSGNSNNWFEKTSTTQTSDKIRVQLFKQVNSTWSIADGILAVNKAEGNNGVDAQDASKISNFSENILFKNGTSNLAIEYRNLPESGAIQPIQLTATTAIPYQLRLFTEDYTNSTLQPYLEDTQTGTFTEIPTDGTVITVPFTGVVANSTTPDIRFRIVYQTNLSTTTPTLLNVSVFPNPVVNNQFNINLGTSTNTKYTLTNLLGQSIQQGDLPSNQNTIAIPSVTKGIYILSVNQESRSYTTKIYVQ